MTIGVANGDASRTEMYTRLVDAGSDPFVFLRNRAIASVVAAEKCDVPLELVTGKSPKRTNRVLFFTGASHWTRRWPRHRWRELGCMLPVGYEAVVPPIGTSLPEFVRIVSSCAAVVSNDTMALHVAAALGVPAVDIVNGVSGRNSFWPYPASLGKRVEVCEPEEVSRIPIPLIGTRLAQYNALSSVTARQVAESLAKILQKELL